MTTTLDRLAAGRNAGHEQQAERAAERREHVARLTRAGHSAAEIAVRLNITPRTVQRDRRATGTAQDPPPPMSDREHSIAARLAADGASASEIARTIGRDPKTVLHHYPHAAWTREQQNEHLRLIHLERSLK